MRRSRVIDRGEEIILYPMKVWKDSRGNPHRGPDMSRGQKIRATLTEDRSLTGDTYGAVATTMYKVVSRIFDLGPFARVYARGSYWDIAAPANFTPAFSRSLRHMEWGLRARDFEAENTSKSLKEEDF